MRRHLQWVIGLLISVAALAWALRDVRPAEVGQALQGARFFYAAPAVALILVGQVARALSWRTILGGGLPFGRVFRALNAGYLLNNVLPFRLGEVGRAYLISRTRQMTTAQALSSVLVERVIDLCMLAGMLTVFVPLAAGLLGGPFVIVAVFLVPVLALAGLLTLARRPAWLMRLVRWGVSLPARLWGGAQRLEDLFHSFVAGLAALNDRRRLATAAAFSALAWLCAGFSAWLLMLVFTPAAGVGMGFFLLVVTGLSIAVPSAPGNLGVWQAAGVAALGVFGFTGGLAFSIAAAHHLVNYGLSSLLGALALAQEGESLGHLAASARTLLTNDERRTTGTSG